MTKANMKFDQRNASKSPRITTKNSKNSNVTYILNDENLKSRCIKVLDNLKKKYSQFEMNGYRNIWIIKPAGMSRGRGIKVSNNLYEILDIIKNKEQQWVVQKYIENPLTILNRKVCINSSILGSGY